MDTRHSSELGTRIKPTWRVADTASGTPAYAGVIQRDELAAADVRYMVRTVLSVWHLDQFADDLLLVATELVTNAARHGRGEVMRITLTRTGPKQVRVSVTDRGKQLPYLQPVDLLAPSGRGLHLVDSLTNAWGYTEYRWGKQVWAQVDGQ